MATFDRHDGATVTGPAFGSTNDTVRVSGGTTINSGVATGAGTDTVLIGASTINGGILTGDNADTVTVNSTYNEPSSAITNGPVILNANVAGSAIAAGAGNDIVDVLNEVQVNGNIVAGIGDDTVTANITNALYPGTTTGSITGTLDGGAGNDHITVNNAVSIGSVYGGQDADIITLNSATTYSGIIHGGDPTTPTVDGNDTINLNAGTFQGGVDGGSANDAINIASGTTFTGSNQITGGVGNDTLNLNGGAFSSGSSVAGGTGSDVIVISTLESNLTINGNEDGPVDGTADGDIDTLDLSALIGKVVYTASAQPGESGVFTENGSGRTITFSNIETIVAPLCFTAGTMIETIDGPRAIEMLRVGDLIETRDNGYQPLRWIGSRRIDGEDLARHPKLRPILVPAGALGENMPESDLILSPQHRVLVRSAIAKRMFDRPEVLIAVKHLVGIFGIRELSESCGVTYLHLLFDAHEIVTSNGTYAESLFLGSQALETLTEEARAEIALIFPEVLHPDCQPNPPARTIPTGREGRQLSARHWKNARPLYMD